MFYAIETKSTYGLDVYEKTNLLADKKIVKEWLAKDSATDPIKTAYVKWKKENGYPVDLEIDVTDPNF